MVTQKWQGAISNINVKKYDKLCMNVAKKYYGGAKHASEVADNLQLRRSEMSKFELPT